MTRSLTQVDTVIQRIESQIMLIEVGIQRKARTGNRAGNRAVDAPIHYPCLALPQKLDTTDLRGYEDLRLRQTRGAQTKQKAIIISIRK